MIPAGVLRELIKIQRPERVLIPDSGGAYETVYNDILPKTYAKVTEVSPSNEIIASQQNLKELVEFIIRYRQDINIQIGDRIIWREFNFTVASSMKVDPLRTRITITAVSEIEESNRTHEGTT